VLPTILTEVSRLDPSRHDFFERLVELAEHDPLFAAQVIHVGNSVAYQGQAGPVLSVRVAIARMGSRAVREILMTMGLMRVFRARSDSARAMWLHSLQVAIASARFARETRARIDTGTMYLAALLHDVGRLVMLDVAPDPLGEVDETSFRTPAEIVAFERSVCGLDHARLGAKAAEAWGLPRWIVRFIQVHHCPKERVPADLIESLDLLHTADLLSTLLCTLPGGEPYQAHIDRIARQVALQSEADLSHGSIALHIPAIWSESHEILDSLGL